MRQAIEEKFILDVLENYTAYKTYWRLLKTMRTIPLRKRKSQLPLRLFVDLHEHAIRKKVEIMVEHFHSQVPPHRKQGQSHDCQPVQAHAVRYKLVLDAYL